MYNVPIPYWPQQKIEVSLEDGESVLLVHNFLFVIISIVVVDV